MGDAQKFQVQAPEAPEPAPALKVETEVQHADPDGKSAAVRVTSVEEPKPPEDTPKEPEAPEAPQDPPEATEPPEDKPQDPPKVPEGSLQDALDAYGQEYAKNGGLSEKSYQDLQAKGLSKQAVDAYILGAKAQADAYARDLAESVGGPDQLKGLLKWAEQGLSEAEQAAVNKTITSMDAGASKLLLAGIQARYTAAVGQDPQLVQGEAAGTSGGTKPFTSAHAVAEAMRDPRYREDPSYQAEVYRRLSISNL